MFFSTFSVLAVSNQRATGCDNPVADESICEDAEGGSEDSDSSSDDSSSNDNNSRNKSERKMYVISLSHPRGAFRTLSKISDGYLCKNSQRLSR